MRDAPVATSMKRLQEIYQGEVQRDAALAPYTSARIGGPADLLIIARTLDQLKSAVRACWVCDVRFRILGGGSNVLVSDAGVRAAVIINRASKVDFFETEAGPRVRAESGASLGVVARRAVERGWSGLEWATTVPGTIGGAVIGNAGAHGGDMAANLEMAEILQQDGGEVRWPPERLAFGYRRSRLKGRHGEAVVLAATMHLEESKPEVTKAKALSFQAERKLTQPAGASIGSMFKNPPGDYAGRLIDQAGLKGRMIGAAQISEHHGNFFVNLGGAKASEVWELIRLARQTVAEKFGVELELEIELIGNWAERELNESGPKGIPS
jgi:UDP-N-acetylmuramate dehydrogenase